MSRRMVTPLAILTTPRNLSQADVVNLRNAYWIANAARPSLRLVPTYEGYRHQLYGPPGRDWFAILNYGLITSSMALVGAILYLAASSA